MTGGEMNEVRKTTFMRALVVAAIALVALVVLMTGSAVAITGNWVTDNEHPFVGLVCIYNEDGDFIWRGSGSLISPTVVLTAGHIVDTAEGAASARVYFQQDAGAHYDPALGFDPKSGYPLYDSEDGLSRTSDELYNYGFADFAGFPNTHDAGLVILDQPIIMSEYGQLPEAGVLDSLATARGLKKPVFTPSGYGLTYSVQEHSALSDISYRSRLMARSTLVSLRSHNTDGFNLQTQGLPGRLRFKPDRGRHVVRDELAVPGYGLRLSCRHVGSTRLDQRPPARLAPRARQQVPRGGLAASPIWGVVQGRRDGLEPRRSQAQDAGGSRTQ